jgi:4-hydroxybenzoate polyprenyltransferase
MFMGMKWLRYLSWLSIDVSAGAVVMMHFMAHQIGVHITWYHSLGLALSVWFIYLLDHWLDTSPKYIILSERRQFHKNYRRLIFGLMLVCLAGLALLFPYVDGVILSSAAIIALAGLIYFLLIRFYSVLKEIWIAMVYTCGIALVPLSWAGSIPLWLIFWLATVFLLAFYNLLLFSFIDAELDQKEGHPSLAMDLRSPGHKTWFGLSLLSYFGLTFFGYWFFNTPLPVLFFQIISMSVLFMLYRRPHVFQVNDGYRFFGDSIFWLPVFIL